VVIRRLRCTRGEVLCRLFVEVQEDFRRHRKIVMHDECHVIFAGKPMLGFWSSVPITVTDQAIQADIRLRAGEEVWCAFGPSESAMDWTEAAATALLHSTIDYWRHWTGKIRYRGPHRDCLLRSAMLVHLLTFAPSGALIASPTTSLPERIGGERNYDYRYTWIRDASLGLQLLARLGLTEDAKRFIDWLADLESESGHPLQVLYAIDGRRGSTVVDHKEIAGYRRSRPVRTGNAAVSMLEIDSFGYLTECVLTYLRHGGEWEPKHWTLVRRLADYTAQHWREPGASIWELKPSRQFLASKIMSVVVLDRATQIAEIIGENGGHVLKWRESKEEIFAEIMSLGWSDRLGYFRQYYGADALDASALLIPLMGLLPVHHPRVTSTMERLIENLDINGFLHRFVDTEVGGGETETVGEAEGAFFICTFWLAQLLAQRDETKRAEEILRRAEEIAGELRLFSEAVDARDATFLGNTPLVFSQIEYSRAAIELDDARERARS
jgi:GH15 family glucan-1,4-alpha-glucosidase